MDLAAHPLTALRDERGLSLADLARILRTEHKQWHGLRSGIDRNRIWKWEHGVEPTEEHQLLLARALGVPGGDVLRLGWPWWLPGHSTPLPFTPAGSRTALREAVTTRMDRRSFLVFSGTALAAAAGSWAASEPALPASGTSSRRVTHEQLLTLEGDTAVLRGRATLYGPLAAPAIEGALGFVINLLDQASYSDAHGRRLHLAFAQLAQTLAWLRFDAARHGAAQRLWQAALHAAHQAGDRDLGAGVLSDLAYSCTWLGYPKDAAQILDHARTRTTAPAARSLLDLRHARALAVLGDRPGVHRMLARAERQLEAARAQTAPAWVSWMSPADLSADAGRCWLDLGDRPRAQATIDEGLHLLDPNRARTRAVFLTYQGERALHDHDVEEAAATARLALDTALDTGAARCTDLATALIRKFDRRQEPAAVELREYARLRLAA